MTKKLETEANVGANQRLYTPQAAAEPTLQKSNFSPLDRLAGQIRFSSADVDSGRYKMKLYRFLAQNVPSVSACIWTWSRLTAASGRFTVDEQSTERHGEKAADCLKRLSSRLYANPTGNRVGLATLMHELSTSLFRDGIFGGFVTVYKDGSGIDRFLPIDPENLQPVSDRHGRQLFLDTDHGSVNLARPDFYYIPLTDSLTAPFGRSILESIPFIAYIEQQLIDDMRRASHNSGFHRLHVRITPPERMSGESDPAFTNRINEYFDATLTMIRSCEVDDNPVTWDNVEIGSLGPDRSRDVTNSWFMTHRAMIEEICAGTNLAPFMLGYSFGATTSWSDFKFEIVMRQVQSVQRQISHFLSWLGNIELALAGINATCDYEFDNTLAYQVADKVNVESAQVDNLLKLYQAGLIDEETARKKAWRLL